MGPDAQPSGQAEVDQLVTEQAEEESAWEKPVAVSRPKWASLALRWQVVPAATEDLMSSGDPERRKRVAQAMMTMAI